MRSYDHQNEYTPTFLSIGFAVLGYISTALHSLRAQQHRGRVDRVNEQLKELYGPLLAVVTASKSSYNAMLRQAGGCLRDDGLTMKPSEFRAAVRADPEGQAASAYRAWVRTVLMPLSEKAAQLVIQRADLLEGSGIEPLLLQLVAHVGAMKVLVQRWDESDAGTAEQSSLIAYPDELHGWVQKGYSKLKKRQAELLGIGSDGEQGSPLMRLIASKL